MAASHGLRVQTRKLSQQISTVTSIYIIRQIQHGKYNDTVRELALEKYS